MTTDLDRFDRRLLQELQRDGRLTNAELGEQVNLSASQISRRVQRLIEEGFIKRFQAVVDPQKVGIGLTAYCLVTLKIHGGDSMEAFNRRVLSLPQILECHSLTGEADYLLKVAVRDLRALADFMAESLMKAPELATIRSSIVLDSVKESNTYDLGSD
jgi:DNA-binding Lrp family transcriptional regulator